MILIKNDQPKYKYYARSHWTDHWIHGFDFEESHEAQAFATDKMKHDSNWAKFKFVTVVEVKTVETVTDIIDRGS